MRSGEGNEKIFARSLQRLSSTFGLRYWDSFSVEFHFELRPCTSTEVPTRLRPQPHSALLALNGENSHCSLKLALNLNLGEVPPALLPLLIHLLTSWR